MPHDRRPSAFSNIDFGQRLRAAREKRGAALRDISETTKIPVNILQALEGNDVKRLPGGIFTRSFVKAYAVQVGLDPEETLVQFQHAFPDHAPAPERVAVETEPDLAPDRRLWPIVLLATLLVVLGAAGAAWYGGWRPAWLPAPLGSGQLSAGRMQPLTPPGSETQGRTSPERVPEAAAQEPPVATSDAAVAGVASPPASAQGALGTDAEPGALPATPAAAGSAPVESTTPAPVSPPAAPVVDSAAVPPPAASPLRLVIQPSGPCWVKVTADGSVQLARLVQPGEQLEIEAATVLQVEAGDAAAFAYTLDGRPGRSLGGPGRVARVRIDHANAASFVTP